MLSKHPLNLDRMEIRDSITVEFVGTSSGTILVHLFNDGTIRTREQMHQESNQRAEEDRRLTAEENKFPSLNQTVARRQALATLLARVQALRNDRH